MVAKNNSNASVSRLWFVAILCLLPILATGQTRLKKHKINVLVNSKGDALVTEQRYMDITSEGTECYIVLQNLRGIELSNFSVADETGTQYSNLNPWAVSASRKEKSKKCGIVEKGANSYELCWGLGELDGLNKKEKVYTVKYTLNSLLKSYNEAEGFNHMFVTPEIYPTAEHIQLSVEFEDTPIDTTNARGWAFGFEGYTEFKDGRFEVVCNDFTVESSMIIMLALKKDIIHPTDTLQEDFQDIVDLALEGSYFTTTSEPFWTDKIAESICTAFGITSAKNQKRVENILFYLFSVITLLLCVLLYYCWPVILMLVFNLLSLQPLTHWLKRRKLKQLVLKETGMKWCRDIPFNRSLFAATKALNSVSGNISKNMSNAIGGYILRLFQKGELIMSLDNGKQAIKIGPKKQENLNAEGITDHRSEKDIFIENTLYHIFNNAAGKDKVLQEKELSKWIKGHSTVAKKLTILKEKSSEKKNIELGKLLCLKQFLKDFTIIEERGVVEVNLWNEYLVFASLFGIANKVKEDFKKVCPEYFQMSSVANNLDTHTLLFSNTIHSLANTTSRAVRSSVVSTYTSSSSSIWSSSSSGFGGRSSFSGGGGFSGGGRGGGVR